jgi:hypothetical protein
MRWKFSSPVNATPQIGGASWIRVEGDELPHPILIRLALSDDGRLVASGLIVESDGELTTRSLRLPLARIVAEFAAAAAHVPTYKRLRRELMGRTTESAGEAAWTPQIPKGVPDWWLASDFIDTPTRLRQAKTARRPGRRGYPDQHYREVAKAYTRAARQHPRAPIQALMKELHATEPTVHRWLRTARERGYLPPTTTKKEQ